MTFPPRRRPAAPRWSPYEQPHDPEPACFVAGERVRHHHEPRPGHVVRTLARDGLVEVDFGRHGLTVIAAEDLEPASN
ncbi:MAG: hypothetical protein MSC31_15135 [Solirubrobacteraceae bacterium MAG38_C4-C5]|nr:hypothetical protein [Candidatus Siliceabacter maunaloa]